VNEHSYVFYRVKCFYINDTPYFLSRDSASMNWTLRYNLYCIGPGFPREAGGQSWRAGFVWAATVSLCFFEVHCPRPIRKPSTGALRHFSSLFHPTQGLLQNHSYAATAMTTTPPTTHPPIVSGVIVDPREPSFDRGASSLSARTTLSVLKKHISRAVGRIII